MVAVNIEIQAEARPGELARAVERATAEGRPPQLVVHIGVDLGQKRDPTAIAVMNLLWRKSPDRLVDRGAAEGTWAEPGSAEAHWVCRHLERLPLGTSYVEVARRIADVARGAAARTSTAPHLFLDATGLGAPVVDVLREAGVTRHAGLTPVFFTHGDRLGRDEAGGLRLGKAYLVSRLQALLEGGRLHLPDTREARQLERELRDYEIRIDEQANDRYGAFKVGTHDDLVTAVGLAVVTQPVEHWVY